VKSGSFFFYSVFMPVFCDEACGGWLISNGFSKYVAEIVT
jgi:hypothetical protein